MNGDGKFDKGRYTTIPETKNIKLLIGGKIRLGIRVKNEQGIEYPKETDYFVCPKEVREVFGEEPTELTVFFPLADREKVFPQCYEKYGSNEALLCQGDGEVSKTAQRLNLENGKWETVKCPCEHYNKKYDKKTKIGGCVKAGYLKFMIPSVSIGTFYQCRVGGVVSVEECNSAFKLAEVTTGGCWAMIPFRMRRVAKKLKIPGTANMKTHWVVTLEIAASTEEIRRVMSGEILYLGQQRNKRYEIETAGPAMGKDIEPIIEVETEEEIKAREAKEAEQLQAKQEALIKENEEINKRQANLKKEMEEGKHKLKSYEEAKAIYKKKQKTEVVVEEETEKEKADLATQAQMDIIYGNVICEECGTRVYGFRCPKCKNLDLHVIEKGFYHSHLMTKDDFKKEMKPAMYPYKLTKIEAMEIYEWWRGDKDNNIKGERAERVAKEKKAKPAEATKEERMKVAKDIIKAGGKLEVKNKEAPFPDETIADEDIPGSSYNNAIPRGKAKGTS